MSALWTFTWEAGPDAGATALLGCGAHIVGRAPGAKVHCADRALAAHHLLIEISPDSLVLRQLCGRVPARIDGDVLAGPTVITAAARVEVGHSVLRISREDLAARSEGPPRANINATATGCVVVRWPRALVAWEPELLHPPAGLLPQHEISGGVLPAVLALAASGLVSVLLHQPMFLIFGALGAIVAFATWGGQRIGIAARSSVNSVSS